MSIYFSVVKTIRFSKRLLNYAKSAHFKTVIHSLADLYKSSSALKNNIWNTFVATMPCFNNQADALQHCNTFTRCVTIITISFVVLISTTYYQTLLLSSFLVKDTFVPPLTMQEIASKLCWPYVSVMFTTAWRTTMCKLRMNVGPVFPCV